MADETKDFIIKDRRIFSQDADQSENREADKAPAQKSESGEPEKTASETSSETQAAPAEEDLSQLPEINFATFIFSLNSSCLVHLGVIDDPAAGRKNKNLALAKQTIDILGMMQEKTKGNLASDEETMLKNILYDLRIIYVKEKS